MKTLTYCLAGIIALSSALFLDAESAQSVLNLIVLLVASSLVLGSVYMGSALVQHYYVKHVECRIPVKVRSVFNHLFKSPFPSLQSKVVHQRK